jgi:tRNA pseudouridine38-40 synthase
MRFLKLTIAYQGTAYSGWQRQKKKVTVQSVLELALRQITEETISTAASGRTDAGVHALGQVVSCSTSTHLSNDVLRRALNAVLPHDLTVLAVEDAPDGFHAINDALSKRYRYQVQTGPLRDVFLREFAWHVWHVLDFAAMQQGAQLLLGKHDFRSFQTAGSARKSTVRHVTDLTLQCEPHLDGQLITLEIEADGFLYRMVRNIVGSLVEVGRGRQSVEWIGQTLQAKDRRQAGVTAPPQGLYLVSVCYGNSTAGS